MCTPSKDQLLLCAVTNQRFSPLVVWASCNLFTDFARSLPPTLSTNTTSKPAAYVRFPNLGNIPATDSRFLSFVFRVSN
jgi:hypothetical protein